MRDKLTIAIAVRLAFLGLIVGMTAMLFASLSESRQKDTECGELEKRQIEARKVFAKQSIALCERFDEDPSPCIFQVLKKANKFIEIDRNVRIEKGCTR